MLELITVLLAAGASRRLGRPKQLVVLDGEPLVRRSARLALAAGTGCHVVLGKNAPAVGAALEGLPVTCVMNPDWSQGMGRSIACGVASLPETAAGVLLLPCDLPRLTLDELMGLVAAWRAQPALRVAARYPGRTGIPVIFPRDAFVDLVALDGDHGAAAVLRAGKVLAVDCPNAACDLDTPETLSDLTRS